MFSTLMILYFKYADFKDHLFNTKLLITTLLAFGVFEINIIYSLNILLYIVIIKS